MSFTAAEANTIRIKTAEKEERELPFAVSERVVCDTKMCMYKNYNVYLSGWTHYYINS